jgi:hypothetical protein
MNSFWDYPVKNVRRTSNIRKTEENKKFANATIPFYTRAEAIYRNNSSLLESSLRKIKRNMVKAQSEDPP